MEIGSVSEAVSAAAAVAVAVVAWWQLGGIRAQVEQSREEAKIERTLAACSRYESDVVIERCVRELRLSYESGLCANDPCKHKHEIIMVLNYLDSLAIGFEQG